MNDTFTFETAKKKPSPRWQAAQRFASALRSQGFLPRMHFIDRIAERGLGGGIRFDPRTFRSEFFRAAHYRQTRPGYKLRIAVVRGVPILYRAGGRSGKQIVLAGALPPGSDLPPSERISATLQQETQFEFEQEEAAYDRSKAVRLNRCMREWLGWNEYRGEIYALLGFTRICPTEAALADAVRRWQEHHQLEPDGILGLDTLNSLDARLGYPTLTTEPARPSWVAWDPSPNFSARDGQPIDTIVLHATGGGSVRGALQRFKNRKSEASAHYVVLRNGNVLQLVELGNAAWHTSTKSTNIPNMNQRSIGIEIVCPGGRRSASPITVCEDEHGSGTQWTCDRSTRLTPLKPLATYYRPKALERFVPYSEAQYRSVIKLVTYLVSCIPTIRLITGHEHLHKWHGPGKRFKNRVDPGGQFDWPRLESALASVFSGHICHRFSRLSSGTNRLNPAWIDHCGGLP